MRRITTALIAALTAISLPAIAADPTDIVTFVNGDRLTGEFKSLERGKLRFKTAATDTILIEWDNVAFLKSDQNIQVETENGARYLGHLSAATDEKRLAVEMSSGPVVLENEHVILMTPIEGLRRDRIDGDISAGYTFAKAKSVKTTNLSFDLSYRTESRILELDYDTLVTDSSEDDGEEDDEGASQDLSLALEYKRLLRNRWLAGGIVRFERNDELGLDLRTSIGGGGGRILRQSDNSSLSLTGGLFVSRENTVVSDPDIALQGENEDHVIRDYLEASVNLTWDWFRYDTPELDLTTTLQIFPNLTDSGEYRGEFEIELKWEIIADLFWSLSITDTYDSKVDEISGEGEKNDYSIITSVGWDF